MAIPRFSFALALALTQIILLGFYAGYGNYSFSMNHSYGQFQDVHVMIFIGFGFLMTFLKKYGFGAVSYNLLLASVTVQWATLINAWVKQRIIQEKEPGDIQTGEVYIGLFELLTADFTAAAVLITYGAVLGKASRLQLLVISILECIFFAINEALIVEYLHTTDVGGSVVVHLFGAYFGLTVAAILGNSEADGEVEESVYHSDLFSMIGTLFLWVFWPSFNAGAIGGSVEGQSRAIVNTYFSLASCVCATFIVSSLVHKNFKIKMVHIQNATLAGGVAVGTSADLYLSPWGAILIGALAGIISTLGYDYVTPFMSEKLKIHDTCGVHNLHGMPAVFAGIVGAIATAAIDKDKYSLFELGRIYPKIANGDRSRSTQGGFQFAAVCVAFTSAVIGGLITGFIVKFLDTPDSADVYSDEKEFEVPEGIPDRLPIYSANQSEMKDASQRKLETAIDVQSA